MKYQAPKSEGEILPNKLDLTDSKQIEREEYRDFLRAEQNLSPKSKTSKPLIGI